MISPAQLQIMIEITLVISFILLLIAFKDRHFKK
jgi:hypothetical protein